MTEKRLTRIIDGTVFEAEDGTLFASKEQCQAYEKGITT